MDRTQIIATITSNKKVREIVIKAAGSFMRGESPTTFLKNLAMTEPLLKGYDFDNIDATTEQICKDKNADMESMKADISDLAKSYIK